MPVDTYTIAHDIGITFLRWSIGWLAGGLFGLCIALSLSLPLLKKARIEGVFHFLRAVPILGLVPVVQMFVGINERAKIGLIAWAVAFPVWLSVRAALHRELVNQTLILDAAGVAGVQRFRVMHLPRLLGGLLSGLEIGIGIAWLSVVAAEWVGTFSTGFWAGGLGYRLVMEYEANDWKGLFLVLAIFGILGLGTSAAWHIIIRGILRSSTHFDPTRWLKRG